MNQEAAIFVLTNLRKRAENSDSSIVLTSVEVRALQVPLWRNSDALAIRGERQ